jgi:macrodomain Ter protein organizer (MatP/YcbG family)
MAGRTNRQQSGITLHVRQGSAPVPQPVKRKREGAARDGARGITIWLEPETWLKLKMLCLHKSTTIQDTVEDLVEGHIREHEA